ncbi:D-Ala-D-Ala carboxypeptidase family metallohydrolase [Candidatus Phyllobacterium onerii]|uniref:D-Ala-D-Ala carboxypeptidase family metallohydrolase n=1 Tax=Candidatus Phyllobacterium onerii TaxID=3020828 RepID=UPI00232D6C08|nr:D-Ala-D-Ala carboxypeptidase family metallohydrolase [Phyllobacterium sp. IY22]
MALQLALSRSGQAVDPDGDFGGVTGSALRRWQSANGFAPSNGITVEQWIKLTGVSPPSLFDLCLGVTSDFEGTKFDKVVGNFDGAGLTFGLIGFTLVNGELKQLLTTIERLKPGCLSEAFGALHTELLTALDLPETKKIAWANSVSLGPTRSEVTEPWKKAFSRLGTYPENRRAQMERARSIYWETACKHLDQFIPTIKVRSDLDAALWYDTAVQNRLDETERKSLAAIGASVATGTSLREQFAEAIAAGSSTAWKEDVKRRKLTFVAGSGVVHGSTYNLNAWGLTGRAITAKELSAPSPIADLVASGAVAWNTDILLPDPESGEANGTDVVSPVMSMPSTGTSPHAAWPLYDKFRVFADGLGLRHITVDELLFLGGQDRSGRCASLNTYPPEKLWTNIGPTAAIIDKLRGDVGAAVRLLSLYRSPKYNTCIQGSAANSFHMQYKAIDFVMQTGNPASWSSKLRAYRANGMFKGGIGVYGTFVHVDTRGENKDWTG